MVKWLTSKVDDDFKKEVVKCAKANGMGLSSFVRFSVKQEMRRLKAL